MSGFLTRTSEGSPRTSGIVVVGQAPVAAVTAERLTPLLDALNVDAAAASGKIAVVNRDSSEVAVFQRMPDGSARLAWCGNAVAAALMITSAKRLTVIGPSMRLVEAEIDDASNAALMKWSVPGMPAEPLHLIQGGVSSIVLATFNQYIVTHGLSDEELPLVGGNAKVMDLDLSATLPVVRVRVAAGWHGALPITAGAELQLARRHVGWLDDALQMGAVLTASGETEVLPVVEYGSSSFRLTFAPRIVEVAPMNVEAA